MVMPYRKKLNIMKYFWDYIILILSLLGSIASIIGYLNQNLTIEAVVAICFLGVLLMISMFHDWYYTIKYRKRANYINLFSEINTTYSLIRDIKINDVQEATNYLMTYCESVSNVFTSVKGKRIGVCIKLLMDDNSNAYLLTQARDSYSKTHNRKTGSADKTKHLVESNSDFSFIYKNLDSDVEDSSYFHSQNLLSENEYRNSRLNNWHVKKVPFIPNWIVKRFTWPLPYKSTIVVPIFPLNRELQSKEKLRGFLCIDSPLTNAFNMPEDKEILRGMAAELCPIIDKLINFTFPK